MQDRPQSERKLNVLGIAVSRDHFKTSDVYLKPIGFQRPHHTRSNIAGNALLELYEPVTKIRQGRVVDQNWLWQLHRLFA
ncbi:MAG: hypothetical protein ACK56C_04040 [Alphaproteobacteria bacterium]